MQLNKSWYICHQLMSKYSTSRLVDPLLIFHRTLVSMASTCPISSCSEHGNAYSFTPVGYMESCFKTKNGTPRQPSVCGFARARLKILKSVFQRPDHSLEGLQQFSHVWVIYVFHENNNRSFTKAKVKPPRLNGEKTGVFACRSPYRPNPIGMTLARLETIRGDTLHLSGVDIIHGTPVLDIKPYIPSYDHAPSELYHGTEEQIANMNILENSSTGMATVDANTVAVSVGNTSTQETRKLERTTDNESTGKSDEIDDDLSICPGKVHEHCDKDQHQNGLRPDVRLDCTGVETPEESLSVRTRKDSGNIPQASLKTTLIPYKSNGDLDAATDDSISISTGRQELDVKDQAEGCGCPADSSASSKTIDAVRVGDWVSSPRIDQLRVRFTTSAEEELQRFKGARFEGSDLTKDLFQLEFFRSPDELKEGIISILSADPRSTYRRTSCSDRLYYFPLDSVHITCWFLDGCAEVLRVQPLSSADIPKKES